MELARNSTGRAVSQFSKVKNQNGQLIFQAILDLNKLCTYSDIVEQLLIRLSRTSFKPNVLHAIAYILKSAVRFGFIQKLNGGYCILFTPVSEFESPEKVVFKPRPMPVRTIAVPDPDNKTQEEEALSVQKVIRASWYPTKMN
ncbi:uncharacterized protein LOC111079769 [Drosophila obscura]|uniref:uncharacterized protein LOC111079769 n=1 Tax=Drosophila obscura TaxID=7282 RepID=UPI001BB20CBE|nr:uncharacterized protein LOC111079769 [Drosophila obscura]